MWTHDVGTGLVLARAPNSTVEESAAGEEQQEKQASSSPGIAASNGGAASGAGGETPVEVSVLRPSFYFRRRFVAMREAGNIMKERM